MKNKQLYEKAPNGRYVPYTPPRIEDNRLYRRLNNGHYEPVSMLLSRDLGEGVWVVKRQRHSLGITQSGYLAWQYKLEKISDLENPLLRLNTNQLGYVDKILEDVMYSEEYNNRPWQDKFKLQVAEIIYKLTGKMI